jgi:ribosomal protein L11 methyltransferase
VVRRDQFEEATATMIELFPEGFAEGDAGELVELAAYTNEAGAARLRSRFGDVSVEPVAAGWADEWKRFHRPVEIGSLWIGPPWEPPAGELRRIVIDPGQAFGTGAHPTTQLCIELLHELERGSLLDVGCGSGVLAIAALTLGFGPVVAIDSDEAAVEATIRNAAANDVSLDIRRVDVLAEPLPEAEILLANIDLQTVLALEPPTGCRRLLTSGYYDSDRPTVGSFDHVARRRRVNWAADLFERQ